MSGGRSWIPPVELPPDPVPPRERTPPAPVCLPLSPRHRERGPSTGGEEVGAPSPPCGQEPPPRRRTGLWPWFVWSGSLLLAALMIEQTVGFLVEQYRLHPSMGVTFTLLVLFFTAVLSMAGLRELASLRGIGRQRAWRVRACRQMREDTFGQAPPLLLEMADFYRDHP
ncbi:MAG: hypothetical protein HQM02_12960, partial [Magnetococcales bacterium]|nr:hypothetical protein [Magnetococcales bacterium]